MTTFAEIAGFLSHELHATTQVRGVSAASSPEPNTVAFVSRWDEAAEDVVRRHADTLFLVPEAAHDGLPNAVPVPNPRLGYALVVREFFDEQAERFIAPTAVIADTAQLGDNVHVGHFTVIEDGVVVGDGTYVDSHVVLKTGTRVGRHTSIGSHTAIGGQGFGFEVDESGKPVRIGHLGGVVIGDHVEIGQHVAIAQGTIHPTRIDDHVKIDDCVFLAHNVEVGEAAFVIAGAEISGSVVIGKRAWISPEATVIQKVRIGDDALVGIGAVVIKDVDANTVVAGVPAKPRGPRYPE